MHDQLLLASIALRTCKHVCSTTITTIWIPYISVISLIGWVEIVSGRPRPQLPLLGHGWFEQVRVRRVRYSGCVGGVTAVPRTEVRV